jgi:hypothetical protein
MARYRTPFTESGKVLNPEGAAIDATQDGVLEQGNYLLELFRNLSF